MFSGGYVVVVIPPPLALLAVFRADAPSWFARVFCLVARRAGSRVCCACVLRVCVLRFVFVLRVLRVSCLWGTRVIRVTRLSVLVGLLGLLGLYVLVGIACAVIGVILFCCVAVIGVVCGASFVLPLCSVVGFVSWVWSGLQ